jgi:SAM-dependent methyltransferase
VAAASALRARVEPRHDPRYATRVRHWEALTGAVTPSLLAALAPVAGERLLDVGCGAGAATVQAGRLVGAGGRVVGADISAHLVRMARRRARAAGNVSFEVADMQDARVPGRPFDAVLSQFGVMFFADPVAAFANLRAHLRRGGRLCFSCWRSADDNPWSYRQRLADLLPPAAPGGVGPFALADSGRVRELLEAAGFRNVRIMSAQTTAEVAPDAVVDDTELLLMGVRSDGLAAARARVDEHLAPYRTPAGALRLPLAFHIVTAGTRR